MKVNFDEIKNAGIIPQGEYLARITNVHEKETARGIGYWEVNLIVVVGPYSGSKIKDKLFFSPRAIPRLKLLTEACDMQVSGIIDVDPKSYENKIVLITVKHETYTNKDGIEKKNPTVTFDGYETIPPEMEDQIPKQTKPKKRQPTFQQPAEIDEPPF